MVMALPVSSNVSAMHRGGGVVGDASGLVWCTEEAAENHHAADGLVDNGLRKHQFPLRSPKCKWAHIQEGSDLVFRRKDETT
jgi:hypothetical protein